jgi:hypothetical protein
MQLLDVLQVSIFFPFVLKLLMPRRGRIIMNRKESNVYDLTHASNSAGTTCELDFKDLQKNLIKDLYPFIEFRTLIDSND